MTERTLVSVSAALATLLVAPLPAQLTLVTKPQTATEAVSPMLNQLRGIAVTSDGRLWTLTFADDGLMAGEASYSLRLHASSDNGQTWTVVTKMRTPGSVRGSLTTGTDGRSLHVVSRSSNGATGFGIYYAVFDTRAMAWVGTDFEVAKGIDPNNQFLEPVVEVTRGGVVAVCYSTHRQGPWAGQLRVQKGGAWGPVQKVNVDTYGFEVNMQAHGDDLHLAYRSNAGLYGIRYRRFDTNAMAWGAEGEIQVSQANPLVTSANNLCCIAVAGNGDVYVAYASGGTTAGTGAIWLGCAPSGTYAFTTHAKIADDPSVLGGNNSYFHYSLGLGADGSVHALYSLFTETYSKLYLRFTTGTGALGPQIPMSAQANRSFEWVCASRQALARIGVFATLADFSVTGNQVWFLPQATGAAVFHGVACQGGASALPQLASRALPGIGQALNLDMSSLAPGQTGVMALGAGDVAFGPLPLPFELALIGAPGCWLAQDSLVTLGFSSSSQGLATVGLQVPGNPALAGVPLYFQSIVVTPGANGANLLLTNGIAAILR